MGNMVGRGGCVGVDQQAPAPLGRNHFRRRPWPGLVVI